MSRIYTRRGDDGTTGQFYGGRVAKDAAEPEATGAVDEAFSALGVTRALAIDERLAADLLSVQRDLFVVGAELATGVASRDKLEPGVSLVTSSMVEALEDRIDAVVGAVGMPTEFIVPGGNPLAAAIDMARSVTRRAERRAVTLVTAKGITGSFVVPYLNRLADYLFMLARAAEDDWVPSREREE